MFSGFLPFFFKLARANCKPSCVYYLALIAHFSLQFCILMYRQLSRWMMVELST